MLQAAQAQSAEDRCAGCGPSRSPPDDRPSAARRPRAPALAMVRGTRARDLDRLAAPGQQPGPPGRPRRCRRTGRDGADRHPSHPGHAPPMLAGRRHPRPRAGRPQDHPHHLLRPMRHQGPPHIAPGGDRPHQGLQVGLPRRLCPACSDRDSGLSRGAPGGGAPTPQRQPSQPASSAAKGAGNWRTPWPASRLAHH